MLKRKIKDFIHKYEILEKLALSFWSILRIIRAKFIFRKIRHNISKKDFKVIVLGIRTIPTTDLVYFDAIFGHAFKKLGAEVKMLYCDGTLDSCDADTVFRNQKPQCFVCKKFGKRLKNSLNLDCISFSDFLSDSEIEEIKKRVANINNKELLDYQYLDIDVGKHAHASAIRYFLFGKLNLDRPAQINKLREKLVYAMICTKIAKELIVKEKPDCIFMLHGNYSTWGPFLSYFRQKGIDTVIYSDMPPRFGHFIFNRNSKANALISKKIWLNIKNRPLKKEEKERVDNYFERRAKGETRDHKILYQRQFNPALKKQSLLKLLSRKKYLRSYVMYSNLAWDAAIEGSISESFKDVFEWIDKTIEFFKQKNDYQLIIKTHPAELVWDECNQGIGAYIKKKYNPLPENIILLRPDVPLKAYDLITPDTIGIIFNGTLGLELAVLGVPTLVAADKVHYKEAGIVYDIKNQKEYLELLEEPGRVIQFAKDNYELAKKYADFYFFKSMIRVPFYSDNKWATIDWKTVKKTEKLFSNNNNLIKICKKIVNKKDIVFDYE